MTQLNREQLLQAYSSMRTIRFFEDVLAREAAKAPLPGVLHLYCGQEASAAGVCMQLNERDRIYRTHRPHGHCIARGLDLRALILELHAKEGGICHGKGGSMHL